MPIPAPILDNRSYEQLRNELVRRIPVYLPEWTDHNASDPGITLIELVAFLGENLLYSFNQIPEATRLAFLRLLQLPPRPAQPARALVTLTTERLGNEPPFATLVPLRSEVTAGAVVFETRTEVLAWPVSIVAVGRIRAPAPDRETAPEEHEFALRTLDALGGLKANQQAAYYENQTVPADDTQSPVDFGATVDGMLWIAVLREKGLDDENKLGGALLNIGFVPDPIIPALEETDACPGQGFIRRAPAVDWEISTSIDPAGGSPKYAKLAVEGDTTRGLSQQGVVRVRLPLRRAEFGVFPAADSDLLGTGQRPPSLDEETEKKVICWLRAFRHDGSTFGKVRFVGINAAETTQTRLAGPEFLGVGTAQPNQAYPLIHKPIIERSVRLEIEESGAWTAWDEVDGLHASAADDRHFVVDREAGLVRFGNGVRGFPPQIGQRIRVVEYSHGGGAAGNVAPKAISKLTQIPLVKASNPIAARGGAEAESIELALDRIPGELRRRDRAVTVDDFQELALATPGAGIARADCLPRFHPPTKTPERPGVVSVVVWPAEDHAHPNAPLPDRDTLRAVCAWLDQRRLVTTELYVIPPTYRKVAVAVGIEVKDGFGIEAVRRWVELVLRQYLAPLPPFGPDGGGWPLGRQVHGPELEAAALQVEGVKFLDDLKVAGWDESAKRWVPGTVGLAMYEVPELAEISVVEGPLTFNPGDVVTPPDTGAVPVPIPVLREVC